MEVFIIDIPHAGFVVLLHSAGVVDRNVHSSIGILTGNVIFLSEVSPSCLYSIMNPSQIRSKKSCAFSAFCSLIVFAWWKTKWIWNPENSIFFGLESENESLMGELNWLRTSVSSLEFTGRVSVYASVVNWLLSSRQSPTVAGIAAPTLAVVGLYCCRDSNTVHLTEKALRACCLLNTG